MAECFDIAIIGGGASGLVAAISACREKACRVVVFERHERVGKKLLATGNGRCNLINSGSLANRNCLCIRCFETVSL